MGQYGSGVPNMKSEKNYIYEAALKMEAIKGFHSRV